VGYGTLAAAFFILGLNDPPRKRRILYGVLSGWFLACLACTLYVPWIVTTLIIVGMIVTGVAVEKFISTEQRSLTLSRLGILILITGVAAVLFVATFAFRHLEAIRALNGTIYPGQRAAHFGGTLNPATILGAPFDFNAYQGRQFVSLNGTNQSENSSGIVFVFPLFFAWFGLIVSGLRLFRSQISAALTSTFLASFTLLGWAVLPLPSYVGRFLLLDRVSPGRLPPAIALVSVLVLGLFIGLMMNNSGRVSRSVVVVSVSFFVFIQLWAAGLYRVDQTQINLWKPIGIICFLALALLAILLGRSRLGLTLLLVFGSMQFLQTNPIQVGAEALLRNPVSSMVREVQAQLDEEVGWILFGGDIYVRGSLEAAGLRFVSGVSRYPKYDAWQILDPEAKHKDVWNRYAHLAFDVGEAGSEPVFTSPQDDVVAVSMDPCDSRLVRLGVEVVVTQDRELSGCGVLISEAEWSGRKIRAYQVAG
jgi:hypothetical protein